MTNCELQNLETNMALVRIAFYQGSSFECLVTSCDEKLYKEYISVKMC